MWEGILLFDLLYFDHIGLFVVLTIFWFPMYGIKVEVTALSSYEEKEEQFKEQVVLKCFNKQISL